MSLKYVHEEEDAGERRHIYEGQLRGPALAFDVLFPVLLSLTFDMKCSDACDLRQFLLCMCMSSSDQDFTIPIDKISEEAVRGKVIPTS